jgi:hypothetical protein
MAQATTRNYSLSITKEYHGRYPKMAIDSQSESKRKRETPAEADRNPVEQIDELDPDRPPDSAQGHAGTKERTWRNRIVGHAEAPPNQLVANPRNWRTHPAPQQNALSDALAQVGWVQQVVVNQRTGNLVDGHLRVMLAVRHKEPFVPVVYIDVSQEEENLILATLDPLAAMALADNARLGELLEDLAVEGEALGEMLKALTESAGLLPPDVEFREYDESVEQGVQYNECPNCGHRWPK